MSATLAILAGAIAMPLAILVLLAICGAIVMTGEKIGQALGLGDEGSMALGAGLWFAAGGAALGALLVFGVLA